MVEKSHDSENDWSKVDLQGIKVSHVSQIEKGEETDQTIGKSDDAESLALSIVYHPNRGKSNTSENNPGS